MLAWGFGPEARWFCGYKEGDGYNLSSEHLIFKAEQTTLELEKKMSGEEMAWLSVPGAIEVPFRMQGRGMMSTLNTVNVPRYLVLLEFLFPQISLIISWKNGKTFVENHLTVNPFTLIVISFYYWFVVQGMLKKIRKSCYFTRFELKCLSK